MFHSMVLQLDPDKDLQCYTTATNTMPKKKFPDPKIFKIKKNPLGYLPKSARFFFLTFCIF